MVYERSKIMSVINWNKFEMSDFYYSCPYDFDDPANKTRLREVVLWRNVGMVWAWLAGNTIANSGKLFKRDHSTVIHAIKQIVVAYDGYGHTEMIQNIESIKEKCRENCGVPDDVWTNYLISQVRLENNYAKKFLTKK